MTKEEIKEKWKNIGKEACEKGKKLHQEIASSVLGSKKPVSSEVLKLTEDEKALFEAPNAVEQRLVTGRPYLIAGRLHRLEPEWKNYDYRLEVHDKGRGPRGGVF